MHCSLNSAPSPGAARPSRSSRRFGASRPVELDDSERSHLRVALEVWESGTVLPDGIVRLLVALVRADPGGT
jgi:hypothetical protein